MYEPDSKPDDELNDTRLHKKTLKLSGIGYLVGDAAMFAAAAARGGAKGPPNIGTMVGSAAWAGGGLAAACFGNPDVETQLALQAARLERHFRQQGIIIPADARAQNDLLHEKSWWESARQFLARYPSEMLNLGYALGATSVLHDALGPIRSGTKTIFPHGVSKEAFGAISNEFWIGALVLGGALGGLLVKEDPHARENAAGGHILQKATAWVQEKPLRLSGTLYAVNNVPLALKAREDFRKATTDYKGKIFQPYYFSTLQVASYIFSNILLLTTARDQMAKTTFTPVQRARLEDAAARVIAAQPAHVQRALLQDVAHYMAAQKGVKRSAEEISACLAARLNELTGDSLRGVPCPANDTGWAGREQQRAQKRAYGGTAGMAQA